ncbi:flagellar hook-basal body complex protein FliE [Paraferrimonas sedimenticola]|uniref:Flagellar hook-basal body complex protein FliE n=1 Tax=Paraferrimonas sedimenticola TaxID=375674 RepID=A0AA37VWQ0_9GAMM|nr:flagellar hook-basal body complex protein FliE [Paraferrimonas sedimenticola]GLP94975.1 flagellar hook-basal body complex protein FliE [Paraferrimonas sedimenticola]
MDIKGNALFAEMQSQIRSLSAPIAPDVQPNSVNPAKSGDFSALLTQAIGQVNQLQSTASDLSTRLEMGDSSVSLSDTVIAREKASVAFEATVQVRNKLVEAYKDIMNMPV